MSETEPDVDEFLNALPPSTAKVYRAGIALFRKFYAPQGTIGDFLDRIWEHVKQSFRRDNKRIAENTIRTPVQTSNE